MYGGLKLRLIIELAHFIMLDSFVVDPLVALKLFKLLLTTAATEFIFYGQRAVHTNYFYFQRDPLGYCFFLEINCFFGCFHFQMAYINKICMPKNESETIVVIRWDKCSKPL